MSDNVYAQINDRSKLIFKKLVESYLKTGSPSGSETIMKMGGLNLSSASIRSISVSYTHLTLPTSNGV